MVRRLMVGIGILLLIPWTGCTSEPPSPDGGAEASEANGEAHEAVEADGGQRLFRLSSFSFPAPDGGEIAWDGEAATLTVDGETTDPEVLLVQVFQPDCGQCRDLTRDLAGFLRGAGPGVGAVGVAFRAEPGEVRAWAEDLEPGFPAAVGTGSQWVRDWNDGDPLYILRDDGVVAYRQAGWQEGDRTLWEQVVADLKAGRPARVRNAGRGELAVGDRLPAIELPSQEDAEETVSLRREDGRLVFRGPGDRVVRPEATIGFFSRY